MTTTERAMIAKLKPCPFCGEQPECKLITEPQGHVHYYVECNHSGSKVCVYTKNDKEETTTAEFAIAAWNRRAEASKQSDKPDTAQDVVTVPYGFKFKRLPPGEIVVSHKDGSGVVVSNSYDPKTGIAGVVLYKLADAMLAAAPAQPQAEVPGWAWKQAINNPDRDSESGDLLNDADSIESRAREIAAAQARGEGK